jgi:hypothetical protein
MVVLPGGHVSEVENLGVNFPPKKLRTVVYRLPACMIEVMHEALFVTKTVTSWKKMTVI